MNVFLTIYGSSAFKRFLLPALNDAQYSVRISKDLYNLPENISLKLEVMGNQWRFLDSDDYDLVTQDGSTVMGEGGPSLLQLEEQGHSALRMMLGDRHVATVIIRSTECAFSEYEHYRLSPDSPITIGRRRDNAIAVPQQGASLLSGHHASLTMRDGRWYVNDEGGKNGTFLNNRRINQSAALSFGDCIDLFGVRVVFLGDQIAVNVLESGAIISPTLERIDPQVEPLSAVNKKPLEQTFHRSPRQLLRLRDDKFTIDEAPSPKDDVRRTTILGAIGQGLAMALPMLLGCSFMIYAANMQGVGRSMFMYVGLVTAVTSAIIGTIRTLVTMRNAQKDYQEHEKLRHDKYGQYLIKQERAIGEEYAHSAQVLRDRYRPTSEVCAYSADDASLWSKNASQSDFLSHRIGIGDMPFQVTIDIPTRRFSLVEDDLAEAPQRIKDKYARLKDVPLCVDLLENRLVGIIGGRGLVGADDVARTIVTQIAATNSYTEVKLVVIYDEERGGLDDSWGYARWLPHVWNETRTVRYVASNTEETSEVFFELNRIMRERMENATGDARRSDVPLPYYVVVLAAPTFIEGQLLAKQVLNPSPELGLTTLYLAERYEDLPNECAFVIQNDDSFHGMYRVTDNLDERVQVRFDVVTLAEAEAQASRLANVRVIETQTGGDVPDTVNFLDLYGVRRPEQIDVLRNWKLNRTYESMSAIIGQRAGGEPCYLDIHEKYHGPHGLVAGTTGSGKSETLQTLILSLALNYSPDDISFFIIDYKGGGMASLLTGLPHLVGQISNLSGSQVQRALVSIQSEKNRREAIFKEYGVKDIRDYTKLVKSGEAALPVPHLVIVIDEFAEMKAEEPEFIQEVVSVSRVGRSLGIHLIMATQRPAGAVSEDIWANSRFRLCLRVQSRQDSKDMLHRPDAAFLTQAGRCYLQVGNDELFELFQSGYSGAAYSEDGSSNAAGVATMLSVNGSPSLVGNHTRIQRQRERKRTWITMLLSCLKECGISDPSELEGRSYEELVELATRMYDRLDARHVDYPQNDFNTEALVALAQQVAHRGFDVDALLAADDDPSSKVRLPQRPERTQLEVVVAYLTQVAEQNGYTRDYSLFLPPLPALISLPELPSASLTVNAQAAFDGATWPAFGGQTANLATPLGMYDDPLNQRQDAYVFDFLQGGNLAVYGGPQTGKSTLLQTLMYGLVTHHAPDELSIYAVEYSARKFSAFEGMPHVGGVIHENDDVDRIDKLFTLLSKQLERRKQVLGEVSYAQYVQAYGVNQLPALVVVIDNYAAFAQRTNDRYNAFLRSITKEGMGYGIFFAISAGGVGTAEVPSALSENFRTVICLELPNEFDYGSYLRRTRLKMRPEQGVAGRGIVLVGDRPLEMQVAVPMPDVNEIELADKVRTLSQRMSEAWHGRCAAPIPCIPQNPTWEDLYALDDVRDMLASPELLPLGYDAQTAEPYGIDLTTTFAYSISGANKRGKTNALRTLMRGAQLKGARVVLVDYDRKSEHFAKALDIEIITNEQEFLEFIQALMPQVVQRNQRKYALVSSGLSDSEVFSGMQEFQPICIFIENLPQFVERAYHPTMTLDKSFDEFTVTVLERCAQHNIYWFATVNRAELGTAAGRDIYRSFVKDHKGIHMGGKVLSTGLQGFSFDNHNRRTADDLRPVGRGMLAADNESQTLEVVVPLTREGRRD